MTGFDEMKGLQSDIFIYRYIFRYLPIYSCLRQVRDIVTGFDEMKGLQSATYQQKIEVFFFKIFFSKQCVLMFILYCLCVRMLILLTIHAL